MRALWQACFLAAALIWTVTAAAGPVSWDRFSLSINGTRVFVQSGEFHYQRLPVPALWLDIFQKLKANGFNTVSIYFFWSYHSAAPGVFDFTSPGKNVQLLLDMAKEAGLWVIARPGPYCNAETNAGSLALWGSDGSMGSLRTSDERYHQAWEPWIAAIGKIIAKNEIGKGGPIILTQVENELTETAHVATNTLVVYMEQLKTALRAAGVTVPFTSNEKGTRGQSWSTDYQNVGGAVDVYGLDSYPGGLSCTNPNSGFNVVRTYYQWFAAYAFTQPVSFPEFEGGWFSAWGSPTFYDQCTTEHSPEFADVFYKNNIGQRVSNQNLYMAYGGTNWGHSAAPVVYTSYDYSAPIRETRQQTTKLFQAKLINLFSTSSPDLLKTEMLGNGTGFQVSSQGIFTWVLQNPDTRATFTVLQQVSTASLSNVSTSVHLNTSVGAFSVPNVELHGRQSKILVTDYLLGRGQSKRHALYYSTADIATSETFDDTDVLVLYLKQGQTGEFALKDLTATRGASARTTFAAYGASKVASTSRVSSSNKTIQAFSYTQAPGTTAVLTSDNVLVLLVEQTAAWRLWAPADGDVSLSSTPGRRLLILGPYLVRSARVDWARGVISVQGDSDEATTLEAFAGRFGSSRWPAIHTISWNGKPLRATQTPYGSYTATIPGGRDSLKDVDLPLLLQSNGSTAAGVTWYAADALPEADPDYDDSRWTVCNKTVTLSPVAPVTLPVLFSSDYGYYTGVKVYRGRFASTGNPTSVNITASGGLGFGWTAWINGQLLGGIPGVGTDTTTSAVLDFPEGSLAGGNGTNVITVLVDYHGHDETSTKNGLGNPRGLLGAKLVGEDGSSSSSASPGFTSWKIAGNAGGPANIDAVRGPMNEGGLYGERLGWHLPGFDVATDKAFAVPTSGRSPFDGIEGAAGVRFYVTHFSFGGASGTGPAIPANIDIPLGIALSAPAGTVARVELWVNGYEYGKYVPQIGPQTVFPIPPGIINTGAGETNTLALSLWAMTDAGAKLDYVAVVGYDGNVAYDTGFFAANAANTEKWKTGIADLQPGWTNRSKFA